MAQIRHFRAPGGVIMWLVKPRLLIPPLLLVALAIPGCSGHSTPGVQSSARTLAITASIADGISLKTSHTGLDEASGESLFDLFVGPCSVFTARYKELGPSGPLPGVEVPSGTFLQLGQVNLEYGAPPGGIPNPTDGQAGVLHDKSAALTQLSCSSGPSPFTGTVLSTATGAPVVQECAVPTDYTNGNASPLFCPGGGVNVYAWDVYSSKKLTVMQQGAHAAQSKVVSAMCSDFGARHVSGVIESNAEQLAARYYGWSFGDDGALVNFQAQDC